MTIIEGFLVQDRHRSVGGPAHSSPFLHASTLALCARVRSTRPASTDTSGPPSLAVPTRPGLVGSSSPRPSLTRSPSSSCADRLPTGSEPVASYASFYTVG